MTADATLEALEAHLRGAPEDRAGWRVYADALAERGEAALAAAILEAADGRGRSLQIPPPEGADVAWRMGLWAAAQADSAEALRQVLAHPAARLLERLVLVGKAFDPALLEALPAGVVHLEVHSPLRGATVGSLEGLLPNLVTLVWDGILEGRLSGRLVHLQAQRVDDGVALDLPQLAALELDRVTGEDLAVLQRLAPLPALRTLRIGSRAELSARSIDALLRAPIAQGLTRFVTPRMPTGPQRVPVVYAAPSRDEAANEADAGRTAVLAPAGGGRDEFVRAAPPGSPLEADLAFREAARSFGGFAARSTAEGWRVVPQGWGRMVAARMALASGGPAQWLVVYPQGAYDARGRLEEIEVSASVWQVDAGGAVTRPAAPELADPWVEEVPDDWLSAGPTPPDEAAQILTALLDEMLGHWLTFDPVPLWLPLERPDPWIAGPGIPLSGAGPGIPLPARIGAVTVPPALGAYLVWRLRWVDALAEGPAPDLSRWTERLMRRHRLDQPPPEAHPFWVEWRERTRPERSAPAGDRDRVAAHKLTAAGQWLLGPAEVALLARALAQPLDRHRPPPDLDLAAVRAALADEGEVAVTVA